jgi:Holliday junction DNA helicase RuvA
MIEYLEGKLIDLTTVKATVVVSGIGYGIHITLTTFDRICHLQGQNIIFHTTQIFREDSNRLFGFIDKGEKKLFETLHPSIGPKTTLSLLGHLTQDALQQAIEQGEVDTLIKVPGIGKKSAERIIVELKGKLQNVPMEKTDHEDAVQALIHIGYTSMEARKKVLSAKETLSKNAPLQELLKVALKTKI